MTKGKEFKIDFKLFDEFGYLITKEKGVPVKKGLIQLKEIIADKLNLK